MQITKEEIALQLALKQLDNYKYDFKEYGGETKESLIQNDSEIAISLFNQIYTGINL